MYNEGAFSSVSDCIYLIIIFTLCVERFTRVLFQSVLKTVLMSCVWLIKFWMEEQFLFYSSVVFFVFSLYLTESPPKISALGVTVHRQPGGKLV